MEDDVIRKESRLYLYMAAAINSIATVSLIYIIMIGFETPFKTIESINSHFLSYFVLFLNFALFSILYMSFKFFNSKFDHISEVLDQMPAHVCIIDKNHYYHYVNEGIVESFSADPVLFEGVRFGDRINVFKTQLKDKVSDFQDSSHKEGSCEISYRDHSGTHHRQVYFKKINHGEYILIMSTDITHMKLGHTILNEETDHDHRLATLGEMTTTIVHEINNPLTLISGTNSYISRQLKKDDVDIELIQDIVKKNKTAINRIKKIIRGVKSLSSNKVDGTFEQCRAGAIIDDVKVFTSAVCMEKKIDFYIDGFNPNALLYCCPLQISQVLIILVNNAIDAIENCEEKWIRLKLNQRHKFTTISVTDSGHGIPSEKVDKIFDSFYTTKEIHKGTGVGLSFAKKIMYAHNGDVLVNENSRHTQFDVILPNIAENHGKSAA